MAKEEKDEGFRNDEEREQWEEEQKVNTHDYIHSNFTMVSHKGPPSNFTIVSHKGPPSNFTIVSHKGPPSNFTIVSHKGPPSNFTMVSHKGPPSNFTMVSHKGPPQQLYYGFTQGRGLELILFGTLLHVQGHEYTFINLPHLSLDNTSFIIQY